MKTNIFIIAALAFCTELSAQFYYQDATNVDMARHSLKNETLRREIILPQVNGYNVYKADLHSHTFYSDGHVSPEYRVREAWGDGLDILANTEHVEYRPFEGKMLSYLKGYVPQDTKVAGNNNMKVDLNVSIQMAQKSIGNYGITIIPGIEVTRTPETIGHFNALFIKDANTIYDDDPEKSIRKAREQGALIMHNHPGWRRKNLQMTEFEKKVYEADLIDGVEIMNGSEFYPSVVNRAIKHKLFMSANTDIHNTTAMDYTNNGHFRNMTFILAEDQSLESIKKALEERRTLAYSFGAIAGDEQLIKDFFLASIKFEPIREDKNGVRYMRMVNNTSIDYILRFGKGNPVQLRAFTSRNISVAKDGTLNFVVENMWIPGEKQHPNIQLKF